MGSETYTTAERSLLLGWTGRPTACGCRMWTGPRRRGRGRFRTAGRDMLAHRAAAELSGMDIAGMDVVRTCGSAMCCEPSHFRLGRSSERECVVTPWRSVLARLIGASIRATGRGGMDRADRAFVAAVRGCGTVALAAAEAGLSVEMTRYTARRIARRSRALSIRLRGLRALRSNMRAAAGVLTRAQVDTLLLVLEGMSQSDAAARLGVIQASVSSRVALARNALRSNLGAPWALRLHRSIRVMRKVLNVRGGQVKPESWHMLKSGRVS